MEQVLGEDFEKQSAMIPLGRFGFSDKRIQRREQEKKNKAMLDEEARRKKIYEQHLLTFQRGSNVRRDFYTNRF